MSIVVARSLKIPVAAGIMIILLFIGSLSPILTTELEHSKSSYYNIRSSSSNLVDVPVWMVNDQWIYETEIDVSPSLVAGGIKIALLTTVGGLIVAVILQLFYNYLVSKIDSLVNTMEDASITLVDILVKNKLSK